jgi:hypothetical protein
MREDNEAKSKPIPYDRGCVFGDLLFASPRDRILFIRENKGPARLRWLNKYRDRWVELKNNIEQEIPSTQARTETETPVQEIVADTTSKVSSPNTEKDANVVGTDDSAKIAANPPCPPQQPLLDAEWIAPGDTPNGPVAEGEITIDGRRCLSAGRYAAMRGISRRSLDRLCTQGKAPPKHKVGNKVFFEAP